MDAYALPVMFVTMVLLIAGGLWFDREPRQPRTNGEGKPPAPDRGAAGRMTEDTAKPTRPVAAARDRLRGRNSHVPVVETPSSRPRAPRPPRDLRP